MLYVAGVFHIPPLAIVVLQSSTPGVMGCASLSASRSLRTITTVSPAWPRFLGTHANATATRDQSMTLVAMSLDISTTSGTPSSKAGISWNSRPSTVSLEHRYR